MSRALRMGIGLVSLIPVMGIAGGVLVAAGVEGLTVGWLTLGIGILWFALVVWWARRAPAPEREPGEERRGFALFRHTRMR